MDTKENLRFYFRKVTEPVRRAGYVKKTNAIFTTGWAPQDVIFAFAIPSDNGCWIWKRRKKGGYGVIKDGLMAHRFSYEAFIGPIPDGLTIDHLCRNPSCVNPQHLEPVTLQENIRRSIPFRKRPTHCVHGHEFSDANTYFRSDGARNCRQCAVINIRRLRVRRRENHNAR